jgi:hypothetical protein
MATLLINDIPEQALAELADLARQDNVPLEEEAIIAIRHYANSRRHSQGNEEGMIPREHLLAEVERFHAELVAKGVPPTTREQLQQYKVEGRE